MKILHLGNTNNIGYLIVKFLRKDGINATLLVDRTDFISYDPRWTEPGQDMHALQEWIMYYRNVTRHKIRVGHWQVPFPYFHRYQQLLDVIQLAKHYDLLQAYNYDVILCLTQLRKPFLAFCVGGDLNVAALSRDWIGALMRLAYRRARFVFYSNINMLDVVCRLKLRNARYMPLPVDLENYTPISPHALMNLRKKLNLEEEFVCFSPTRHDWQVKGNDKLILAWAKQVGSAKEKSMKLVLCEWGNDLKKSKELVNQLGLTPTVLWLPLMNKSLLRSYYWAADVVLDQFNLGAFGLTTLEAMACGKPVIMNCNLSLASRFYPEPPPICSADSVESIGQWLTMLWKKPNLRQALGDKARQWIEQYHNPAIIVSEHVRVYQKVLDNPDTC